MRLLLVYSINNLPGLHTGTEASTNPTTSCEHIGRSGERSKSLYQSLNNMVVWPTNNLVSGLWSILQYSTYYACLQQNLATISQFPVTYGLLLCGLLLLLIPTSASSFNFLDFCKDIAVNSVHFGVSYTSLDMKAGKLGLVCFRSNLCIPYAIMPSTSV